MKITIVGDIAKARLNGEARVNEKTRDAIAVHIPTGLGPLYAEKHRQAKAGVGRMVSDYAEVNSLTNKQALDELKTQSDAWESTASNIEKMRQSAILAINSAKTVSEIDAIIEGMTDNG